jgi:hypothetical protein
MGDAAFSHTVSFSFPAEFIANRPGAPGEDLPEE